MLCNACKLNKQTERPILVPHLEIDTMPILMDANCFIVNTYFTVF